MLRFQGKTLENKQIQSSLWQIDTFGHIASLMLLHKICQIVLRLLSKCKGKRRHAGVASTVVPGCLSIKVGGLVTNTYNLNLALHLPLEKTLTHQIVRISSWGRMPVKYC